MKALLTGALLALLALAVTLAGAGAQAAPRIIGRHTSTFTNIQPPGRYVDLSMTISELGPGAVSPTNIQAATRYFTVVEGSVRVTIGSESKAYPAGATFVVPAGMYVRISNEGSTRTAQLFISSMRNAGAPLEASLVETPTAPGPRLLAQGLLRNVQVPTSGVALQQVVQDWEPGARNAPHTMNHPHLFIALTGENTTRFLDGGEHRTGPGQQGVMEVGRPGIMENTGTTVSRLMVVWLLTSGAPNTSPVSAPAPAAPATAAAPTAPSISPPATGDAGLADAARPSRPEEGVTALAVVAAVATAICSVSIGWRVRRRARRRSAAL